MSPLLSYSPLPLTIGIWIYSFMMEWRQVQDCIFFTFGLFWSNQKSIDIYQCISFLIEMHRWSAKVLLILHSTIRLTISHLWTADHLIIKQVERQSRVYFQVWEWLERFRFLCVPARQPVHNYMQCLLFIFVDSNVESS